MKRFFGLIKMLWKGYLLQGEVSKIKRERNIGHISDKQFLIKKYALVYQHRSKMVREGYRSFYEEFQEFFYIKRQYIRSEKWRKKIELIMEKYNHKCYSCGSKATKVHHETYQRLFNEHEDDLKPLCGKCYEKQHMLTGMTWVVDHIIEREILVPFDSNIEPART